MGINQRAEIVLTADEAAKVLAAGRSMTVATVGPNGQPHLVAMWYALVDGAVCFESKAKSQKILNLRRDPRLSCLLEDGLVYEQLRGLVLEGTAELVEDPVLLWPIGVSMFERYYGPFTDDMAPYVQRMLNNRVGVRLRVERTRSWDHAKLGLPSTGPPGGTTALDPSRRSR